MIEALTKMSMGFYAFWHYADPSMKWLAAVLAVPLLIVAVAYVVDGSEKPGSGDRKDKVEQ